MDAHKKQTLSQSQTISWTSVSRVGYSKVDDQVHARAVCFGSVRRWLKVFPFHPAWELQDLASSANLILQTLCTLFINFP
jgi:hypothetical protein